MYLTPTPQYWMPTAQERLSSMPMIHHWSAVEVPQTSEQIESMDAYLNLLRLRIQWLLREEAADAPMILQEELHPEMKMWLIERETPLDDPMRVAIHLTENPALTTLLNLYWTVNFPVRVLQTSPEISEAQVLIEAMSLAEWLGAIRQLYTPIAV